MTGTRPGRSEAPATGLEPIDRRTWQLCWVIVLGAFASGLDASIAHLGLNEINSSLGGRLATTQWVISGYLLALATSLPLAGWLGRRFGRGRVWLVALAAFTVSSVACALAPSVALLITARVLQGLAGGVLIPAGQTILGEAVGPARLGRVMGVLGIAVSTAPAVGPLLGGLILDSLSWPWLFAINVPIGVAGLVLGRALLPTGTVQAVAPPHLVGAVLVSVGLAALVWAATQWGESGELSTAPTVAAITAVVSLAAFVVASRRTRHPLLDLTLYRNPAFRAGSVAALFSGALVFGSGVVHALYFQVGRGLDPLPAAVGLLGAAGATAATAPMTGWWIDRGGPGPVAVTGGLLAVSTTVPMVLLPVDVTTLVVQPLLVVYGAAVSLAAMPAGVAAYRAVDIDQLADAVTQVNIVQRVGGSLGGAVCAVIIATRLDAPEHAFHAAFLALAICAVGATAAGWSIRRSRHGTPHPRGSGPGETAGSDD